MAVQIASGVSRGPGRFIEFFDKLRKLPPDEMGRAYCALKLVFFARAFYSDYAWDGDAIRKIGKIGNHAGLVIFWLNKLASRFRVDVDKNMTGAEIVAWKREKAIADIEYWTKWWSDLGYGDFMQVFRCTDLDHPKTIDWEIVPPRQIVSSVISVYWEYVRQIRLSNAPKKKENRVDKYDPEDCGRYSHVTKGETK